MAPTKIPLSRGLFAVIDEQDAYLARRKWHALKRSDGKGFYAVRNRALSDGPGPATIYLHREILGVTDPKVEVDHKNGDGLDCRRENLRRAAHQQNGRNVRRPAHNTSGFKGVRAGKRPGTWTAYIKSNRRQRHLGVFPSPEAAARAYDAEAVEMFGEFAQTNFPRKAAVHG